MWTDEVGEPISSSGFAMNVRRSNGSSRTSPRMALSAYSPASRPDFMSVTPGPYATPSSIRNGRSAAVPGSNTVSMCPISRTRGPRGVPENVPTTVAPYRPLGSGRTSTSAPIPSRIRRHPAPDLVDASGGVRPAVDVDEALEIAQVGRQMAGHRRAQRVELEDCVGTCGLGGHAASLSTGDGSASHERPSRVAILPGPCAWSRSACWRGPNVYRLEPVVKVELALGRRRTWYGQRDPGRHAIVRLGAAVPARDWPDPIAAIVAWVRRLACRPRRRARRTRRPSLVGPGSLDHHVPVARRGAGTDVDGRCAGAG